MYILDQQNPSLKDVQIEVKRKKHKLSNCIGFELPLCTVWCGSKITRYQHSPISNLESARNKYIYIYYYIIILLYYYIIILLYYYIILYHIILYYIMFYYILLYDILKLYMLYIIYIHIYIIIIYIYYNYIYI